MHIRDSCCGAAACTFTLCCGISCPYFDRMVYQVQSKDTIHITSQYSFGFSHYSWSTLSIMQTSKHSLIAQVKLKKYFICVTSSECLKSLELISRGHCFSYLTLCLCFILQRFNTWSCSSRRTNNCSAKVCQAFNAFRKNYLQPCRAKFDEYMSWL